MNYLLEAMVVSVAVARLRVVVAMAVAVVPRGAGEWTRPLNPKHGPAG